MSNNFDYKSLYKSLNSLSGMAAGNAKLRKEIGEAAGQIKKLGKKGFFGRVWAAITGGSSWKKNSVERDKLVKEMLDHKFIDNPKTKRALFKVSEKGGRLEPAMKLLARDVFTEYNFEVLNKWSVAELQDDTLSGCQLPDLERMMEKALEADEIPAGFIAKLEEVIYTHRSLQDLSVEQLFHDYSFDELRQIRQYAVTAPVINVSMLRKVTEALSQHIGNCW